MFVSSERMIMIRREIPIRVGFPEPRLIIRRYAAFYRRGPYENARSCFAIRADMAVHKFGSSECNAGRVLFVENTTRISG